MVKPAAPVRAVAAARAADETCGRALDCCWRAVDRAREPARRGAEKARVTGPEPGPEADDLLADVSEDDLDDWVRTTWTRFGHKD